MVAMSFGFPASNVLFHDGTEAAIQAGNGLEGSFYDHIVRGDSGLKPEDADSFERLDLDSDAIFNPTWG